MEAEKTISEKKLVSDQLEALMETLKKRFGKNMQRHPNIEWSRVQEKLEPALEKQHSKLWTLHEMEKTGGEPDVIGYDPATNEFIFADCSAESPAGRRNVCYDREARLSRKEHQPENSALEMAAEIGIEILDEAQYYNLQQLGKFDTKTSSWIKTPSAIRELGGALFCDRRYNHVFTYHNGVQSYYGVRGFRGMLRV